MALLNKAVSTSIAAVPDGLANRKARRAERLVAARKSAKAARATTPAPARIAEETIDQEGEGADEAAPAAATRAAAKKSKTDGSGYLSMYFRDMQALHVLRPEEEFTAAREIEALEIMLWETILGQPTALDLVLEALEEAQAHPASIKAMRKAAADVGARTAKSKSAAAQASARFGRTVKKSATDLREHDQDKLWAEAVVAQIERTARGIGKGGKEPPRALLKTKSFTEWVRRVMAADRAAHEARNDFVKANLRLVVSIARRFNHGRMSLADLIQEGNLGLMKAVERYDYRRGFRFSTYASWWIRHAISRALADKGREIRLPVHMIDAQHRLAKARRELTAKLGRSPTSEELAEATEMPVEKIENMRRWVLDQSISIDRPVGDEDGRVLGEVLEDPDREELSPTEDLEMDALTNEIHSLLRELKPIEADILRQRFGLVDDQELTLKEIGEKYNLSRERIRQLQEQALHKMRRALQRKDMM
jgi:RNA polymerase primary sigma factor